MSDIVIKTTNISKKYNLGLTGHQDLRSAISAGFSKLLMRKEKEQMEKRRDFWALRDISFQVRRGESIGIIGKNGAGKSTLLKIFSKITPPTTGRIEINGRVASLLEVGTGFHPELTGRENIFLNGSILGMAKNEIKRKFDEIVAFSGVENFLDTPIKRYSSGMTVRLAFSVAAHLNAEILLIDEVLSVGDIAFQKKCIGKMDELTGSGRTIIFVSHNLGAIKQLCTTGLLLENGKMVKQGNISEVIESYLVNPENIQNGMVEWSFETAPGEMPFKLLKASLKNEKDQIQTAFSADQKIIIEFEYQLFAEIRGMILVLQIWTDDGQILFTSYSSNQDRKFKKKEGHYRSRIIIPSNLFNNRTYKVVLGAGIPKQQNFLRKQMLMNFSVERTEDFNMNIHNRWPGIINPKCIWKI